MATDFMAALAARACTAPQRLVFPESSEETILHAAYRLADEGLARPILIGSPTGLAARAAALDLDLNSLDLVDPAAPDTHGALLSDCARLCPGMSSKGVERRLRAPLNVAALLVAAGKADALVAGLRHTTEDVILAAMTLIGLEENVSTPSSLMLMHIPGYEGPEGSLIVFADCAVAATPDSEELAGIALTTARTVRVLLGWEPRVALLSFSTRGSAEHDSVERVTRALQIARELDPDLLIDGELQLDAAIVPAVAARKVPGESPVAGRANILIFPDLNAGNIACKAVQRFAGAGAYGPFLQGFAGTVSDLSRGSSVEDVVGASVLACVHAQGRHRPPGQGEVKEEAAGL